MLSSRPRAAGWHAVTTRSVGSACPFEAKTCRPAASPRDGMPPRSRTLLWSDHSVEDQPNETLRLWRRMWGRAKAAGVSQVGGPGHGRGDGAAPGAMAGPFTAADFEKLVPADKKLDPELGRHSDRPGTARSLPRQGPGPDRHAGGRGLRRAALSRRRRDTLALGYFQRADYTGDGHYAKPAARDDPVGNVFNVVYNVGKEERWHGMWLGLPPAAIPADLPAALRASEIRFCGQYPIGYVEYRDPVRPIAVSLESSPHSSH